MFRKAVTIPGVARSLSRSSAKGGTKQEKYGINGLMKPRGFSSLGVEAQQKETIISRTMHPSDANLAGNVHGGTILKMIDEAGSIVTMRYFNKGDKREKVCFTALARFDEIDFIRPMHIGEIAQIEAEVSYVSQRSMEVQVKVFAENLFKGTRRQTNRASLWYVPVKDLVYIDEKNGVKESKRRKKIVVADSLPPKQYSSSEEEEAGKKRYLKQRADRKIRAAQTNLACDSSSNQSKDQTIELVHVVLPDDCYSNENAQGGTILKLMDTAAGMMAIKYCKTGAVTASIEAVDFLNTITLGQIVHIRARPVFTSSKSMEIEVTVRAEDAVSGITFPALSATFVFVSLDENDRPLEIKPLDPPATAAEKREREEAKVRYEKRQQARRKKLEAKLI